MPDLSRCAVDVKWMAMEERNKTSVAGAARDLARASPVMCTCMCMAADSMKTHLSFIRHALSGVSLGIIMLYACPASRGYRVQVLVVLLHDKGSGSKDPLGSGLDTAQCGQEQIGRPTEGGSVHWALVHARVLAQEAHG